MKKILLLIICLTFLSVVNLDAGHIIQKFSSDAAACAGDSSSELCEDFDDSTLCYAGYTSTCQVTWTTLAITGSGVIDFDSTLNMGSNTCGDKGTYWLDIYDASFTDTDRVEISYSHAGANPIIYTSFVLYVDDVVASLGSGEYIRVAQGREAGTAWSLWIEENAGTVKWNLYDDDNTTSNYSSSNHPADNTLFEIKIEWDTTNNEQKLTVNGTLVVNAANTITTEQDNTDFGPDEFSSGFSATSMRMQFDSIRIDDTAQPDPCN
jgi:hypothetical protein